MPRVPSLSNFDPRFITIWQRSATENVRIEVPSRADGVRLRARLYSCRKAMEAANHEVYALAAHGSIKLIEEKPNVWVVLIQPGDSEFSSILDRANIDIPDAPEIDFTLTEEDLP